MPPQIATLVYALGILGLFRLDRERTTEVSPALWIPVTWIFLASSRLVSEWLHPGLTLETPDQYLDGSPLDRFVMLGLFAAGIAVLLQRGRLTEKCLLANGPVLLFFLYGAVSVLWSDYPDVAFKRWIKASGNFVMVLVVATDPDPRAAVKHLFKRLGFLLIPLSVLFIKYYPDLGRGYDRWTWTPYYGGVTTTGKNGLGYVCLIFGLSSLWRFLETLMGEVPMRKAGALIAHGVVLAMTLWLFWMADSATSLACFLMAGGLMIYASLPGIAAKPSAMHFLLGTIVFLGLVGVLFNAGESVVAAMGRDPTLTGRTLLWDELLRMTVDPLFGTGFESFWLGERTEVLWRKYWWHPNQAHNGYIEVFLNLGWVGVILLAGVMIWGYRGVVAKLRQDPELGRLSLAFFAAAVVYNLTEAAFKGLHVVWIVFLLAIIVVPGLSRSEERDSVR